MAISSGLRHRHRQPEIMDQPGLDRSLHFHALRSLERINRLSGSLRILWSAISSLAREIAPERPRILDVATGAGDLPIGLWRKGQRAGLPLQADGCDVNPQALEFARRRAEESAATVRFFLLNALHDPLPTDYDVLVSSLFLHHLEQDEAVNLLRRMAEAARRMVLINDLRRSFLGYWLAYSVTRVLTRSEVVRVDGPLSVQAAFTVTEAAALAERAGLKNAVIRQRWPCRFLLIWRKP